MADTMGLIPFRNSVDVLNNQISNSLNEKLQGFEDIVNRLRYDDLKNQDIENVIGM